MFWIGGRREMGKRALLAVLCTTLLLGLAVPMLPEQPAVAATGATTSVHVIKYAPDGTTVLAEKTVSYEWMESNLPVQGNGVTHYYHQGPVFEGDMWDPDETTNFKDKGAVMGTDIKDLCELVGGMAPGDEVMIHAPDGYHVESSYENIYQPLDRQGPIALCWFNGEDAGFGERYGQGYPGTGAYHTAMQLIFLAGTTNAEGKYVFGNWDMHECLPEMSQHFYEIYASTNGLSVKWVDEVRVYSGGYSGERGGPAKTLPDDTSAAASGNSLWGVVVAAIAGVLLVAGALYVFIRRRGSENG